MATQAKLIQRLLANERLAFTFLVLWIGVPVLGVVWDQILLLPSPPPTEMQLMRARPKAVEDWNVVYARIAERQRWNGVKPEFGEVWTIRTGRICGLVNGNDGGVDFMTRFYAENGRPVLREDDKEAYRHWWMDCLDTHWVRLHAGTYQTGFCASKRGRESAFGKSSCDSGEKWPTRSR